MSLELRETEAGSLVLLAYSGVELLVDACGDAQPWIAVAMDQLEGILQESGADQIVWDVALPPELRKNVRDNANADGGARGV